MSKVQKQQVAWTAVAGAIVGIIGVMSAHSDKLLAKGEQIGEFKKQVTENVRHIESNQKSIEENDDSIQKVQTDVEVHKLESIQIQKNIERLQNQVDEGIKLGTERYLEIINKLNKN